MPWSTTKYFRHSGRRLLAELEKLRVDPDGTVVLSDGYGNTEMFTPLGPSGSKYIAAKRLSQKMDQFLVSPRALVSSTRRLAKTIKSIELISLETSQLLPERELLDS